MIGYFSLQFLILCEIFFKDLLLFCHLFYLFLYYWGFCFLNLLFCSLYNFDLITTNCDSLSVVSFELLANIKLNVTLKLFIPFNKKLYQTNFISWFDFCFQYDHIVFNLFYESFKFRWHFYFDCFVVAQYGCFWLKTKLVYVLRKWYNHFKRNICKCIFGHYFLSSYLTELYLARNAACNVYKLVKYFIPNTTIFKGHHIYDTVKRLSIFHCKFFIKVFSLL